MNGFVLALLLVPLAPPDNTVFGADGLEAEASWSMPTLESVESQFAESIAGAALNDNERDEAIQILRTRFDSAPLDALLAAAEAALPALADAAEQLRSNPAQFDASLLERLPVFVRQNVQLWIGRELARERLYDEAATQLAELTIDEVVDPASLLYFRAASQHALLEKESAVADLRVLLENREELPVRYRRTAEMMLADIEPLKEDSLDEISRLMNDVGRRLELGRTGEKVVSREQEVIDKLNKLIEQAEQQQQQQQQQSSGSSGSGQSGGQGSPQQDSQAAGDKGDGSVAEKDLGDPVDWGDLPPAQREEALQQLSQELPTHYREAIEAYFQKLATGSGD